MKRRERTRHLIELGGLVAKSGLVELVDDDRAAILGVLMSAVMTLQGEDRARNLAIFKRRGKQAFAVDQEASKDYALQAPHG